eukprot:gnl/TRDRNA2_/TRDRNA2_209298_c0_seq1.p2 gnl/TRDRNA2_/TRDRNA2_209298_c0~~gnl/TRDRNA2_/TRDRNA2_209298_c0_seq1.p2  ORF type:complete len:125 (-),score=16.79 gnl/TRDRNA2_/TRDRNA2_209298_c0_seq1:76-450(-)
MSSLPIRRVMDNANHIESDVGVARAVALGPPPPPRPPQRLPRPPHCTTSAREVHIVEPWESSDCASSSSSIDSPRSGGFPSVLAMKNAEDSDSDMSIEDEQQQRYACNQVFDEHFFGCCIGRCH